MPRVNPGITQERFFSTYVHPGYLCLLNSRLGLTLCKKVEPFLSYTTPFLTDPRFLFARSPPPLPCRSLPDESVPCF